MVLQSYSPHLIPCPFASVRSSVTPQLDRVDFVMGFVVQLVMEFFEIGNRGDVHGKGSSAGKLLGN
mgnify:CR=1 FL=1